MNLQICIPSVNPALVRLVLLCWEHGQSDLKKVAPCFAEEQSRVVKKYQHNMHQGLHYAAHSLCAASGSF